MEVKELGHVVFYVRDVERSRHFYKDILGWKEIGYVPSALVAFSSGRTHHELLLIQVPDEAPNATRETTVGFYHFGLKIGTTDAELKAAKEELEKNNITIVGMSDHGVTHSLYILDPDENEIELYIDVQPERWREDPKAVLAPTRRLKL